MPRFQIELDDATVEGFSHSVPWKTCGMFRARRPGCCGKQIKTRLAQAEAMRRLAETEVVVPSVLSGAPPA